MVKLLYRSIGILFIFIMLSINVNAQVLKVDAFADTYERKSANEMHETDTDLRIKNDLGQGNDRQALFSFILPEVDQVIEKAVFRFYGNPGGGAPDMALSVFAIDWNIWDDTISYQGLPALDDSIGTAFTLASEADIKSWYEIDVTEMVLSDVDDTIAFVMAEMTGAGSDFWMKASESGKLGPKLVITYGGKKVDALADTYERKSANENHETDTDIRIKNDLERGNDRKALFSFVLPDADQVIERAVFHFYGNPGGGAPDMALSLFGINWNTWVADTLSYQGLPALDDSIGTAFTLASEADVRSWYAIDVTELVLSESDDTVAFIMAEMTGAGADFWMKASESGKLGPKLELTYGGAKVNAYADTYERKSANENHESDTDLRIKNDLDRGNDRQALFSFVLPDTDSIIEKAVFRFYGNPGGGAPDMALSVFAIDWNTWADTISYQGLPALDDSIGTAFTLASQADIKSWYEIDVTEMVLTDQDDTISFIMAEMTGAAADFWMKASESGNLGPKLEITYGGEAINITQDTYERKSANENHETDTDLRIKNDLGRGNDRQALFSFVLPETNQVIEKAIFHFYGNPGGGAPDMALSVFGIDWNKWADTISYQGLPALDDSITSAFTLASEADIKSWYSVDITELVTTVADDTVAFIIAETTGAGSDFWMKASESGKLGPKLELVFGGEKVEAFADTYERKSANENHETDTDLRIKNDLERGNDRKALFSFILPESDSIIDKAVFRFYGNPGGGAPDMELSLFGIDWNMWADTISYQGLPALDDSIGTAFTLASEADIRSWYEIDVTDWVLNHPDDTVAFIMAEMTGAGSDFWMKASESGIGPRLELIYAGTQDEFVDDEAPTMPALTAENVTSTSFDVVWDASTDNVGISHYLVLLNTEEADTTNLTSVTYSGLTPGSSHKVTVIAIDSTGNKSNPGSISVTLLIETTELVDSLASARTMIETYGSCSDEAKAVLETQIAEAQLVLDNTDATQAEVDNALRKLTLAMTAFADACMVTSVNPSSVANIRIYPNPVNNMLHIENIAGFNRIEIYSITSSLVLSAKVSESKVSINTSELNKGIYIVKVIGNESELVKRIIK